MPEAWTGKLIGKMHNNGIKYADLAEEMGVCSAYISMILSGARKPTGIRKRMEAAYDAALRKREAALASAITETADSSGEEST